MQKEIKAKLFGLYLGQKVLYYSHELGVYNPVISFSEDSMARYVERGYLLLRSINQILPSEYINLAKIITTGYQRHFKKGELSYEVEKNYVVVINPNGYKFSKVIIEKDGIVYMPYNKINGEIYYTPNQYQGIDYLRSIGIALPFTTIVDGAVRTVSVEEQIESGIVKLVS